jgi:hypothetical protein
VRCRGVAEMRRPCGVSRSTHGTQNGVQLVDDLDGAELDGTGESITFGLDGRTYEIDLSTAHADELRQVLTPYLTAARLTGRRPAGRPASSVAQARNLGAIREWARDHGYTVSDRGRVSAAIVAAYDATS